MKTKTQPPTTYQGRPAQVTTYLRTYIYGERVIQHHWLDTDTYSVQHLTGKPQYGPPVPGSPVGTLVPGSVVTLGQYAEGEATESTATTITEGW